MTKKYIKGGEFVGMSDFNNYIKNNTALFFAGKIKNVAFVQNWQYRFISTRLHLFRKAVRKYNNLAPGQVVYEVVAGDKCQDCCFFDCCREQCKELGVKGLIFKKV